jgi:hypothetical protein
MGYFIVTENSNHAGRCVMSRHLTNQVLNDQMKGELLGKPFTLMLTLANHVHEDDDAHRGDCFPSIVTLAKECGWTKPTVRATLKIIKEWIAIEPRRNPANPRVWTSPQYYLKKYAKRDENRVWSNGVQTWTENAKGIPKRVKTTPGKTVLPPPVSDFTTRSKTILPPVVKNRTTNQGSLEILIKENNHPPLPPP